MSAVVSLPALLLTHELCDDNRCQECGSKHHNLEAYIEQRLYAHMAKIDVLGRYRSWLENVQGIFCSTVHGWADKKYFAEDNVHGYILYELERGYDEAEMSTPEMKIEIHIRSKNP